MLNQDQAQQIYTNFQQTPIKKTKDAQKAQPNTAQSDQSPTSSIDDIDPEELFKNFSDIITVVEDDQFSVDQPLQQLERTLDYQDMGSPMKLDFDSKASSMKKKKKFIQRTNQFKGLLLFQTELKSQPKTDPHAKKVEPQECLTPLPKKRIMHSELLLAPVKYKC